MAAECSPAPFNGSKSPSGPVTAAAVTPQGAFVWADSTYADFTSAADKQFSVRAAGGARFETAGAGLTVDGQRLGLTANGAFGLGTSGNQPLVFSVNGTPALRLEPTTDGPNVIAGFSGNWVLPGATAARAPASCWFRMRTAWPVVFGKFLGERQTARFAGGNQP